MGLLLFFRQRFPIFFFWNFFKDEIDFRNTDDEINTITQFVFGDKRQSLGLALRRRVAAVGQGIRVQSLQNGTNGYPMPRRINVAGQQRCKAANPAQEANSSSILLPRPPPLPLALHRLPWMRLLSINFNLSLCLRCGLRSTQYSRGTPLLRLLLPSLHSSFRT